MPAAKSDDYVLLTYEVGDLVLNVPDYPCPDGFNSTTGFTRRGAAGMGGAIGGYGVVGGAAGAEAAEGMGSYPGPQSPSPRIAMTDLMRVLVTVIAPETWVQRSGAGQEGHPGPYGVLEPFGAAAPAMEDQSKGGGGDGELQQLGTSLIIRQTKAVHEQIDDLLAQLRSGSGKRKTVAVDARWLRLNSDDLARLIPSGEDGASQVDRQVLAELTRRPSSIRGMTNCFNGQLVYLVSGTRQNIVTSFVPVVGGIDWREPADSPQYSALEHGARYVFTQQEHQRAVGYQPVIEVPNFGALLEIRPTLIPGDDTAIVDLRSTLTAPGKPSQELVMQRAEDLLAPMVDRVAIDTQRLATTLNVPLGRPVLVGGMTYISPSTGAFRHEPIDAPPRTGETIGEVPQLYLILELR